MSVWKCHSEIHYFVFRLKNRQLIGKTKWVVTHLQSQYLGCEGGKDQEFKVICLLHAKFKANPISISKKEMKNIFHMCICSCANMEIERRLWRERKWSKEKGRKRWGVTDCICHQSRTWDLLRGWKGPTRGRRKVEETMENVVCIHFFALWYDYKPLGTRE